MSRNKETLLETASTEENFWQAIQRRDKSCDGLFYYGVKTTKIYCRPSCSSRQPKRENVRFFALPEAAKQFGFRACQRCKPDKTTVCDPQAQLVQNICCLIEQQTEDKPNFALLSQQVKLSKSYLQRLFKRLMGITPYQYAEACRLNRFKKSVKSGQSLTEAIYDAGYSSSSRLYEKANEKLGMTPAIYYKGGKGMNIDYTIATCSLGLVMVAATSKGICAVTLGNNSEELAKQLHSEFPKAQICFDTESLKTEVETLLKHIAGQEPHPKLSLDVQGTAFQKRVWEELRQIPYGQTASYSEIANEIGQPKAIRAVARACAANPVAIATPCHRVIRQDGELGGYRWGIERKKQLLEQEKALSEKTKK